jgi:hypothetical protein
VSAAAAGVLAGLFGDDYHFTVSAESVTYTRSFTSFQAAAAEAGQSRIYGGIHYQFDNQAAQSLGQSVGQFVVGNLLRPAEDGDDSDSPNDHQERPTLPPEELAQPTAGSSNAFVSSGSMLGVQQVNAPANGGPTVALATAAIDKAHAGAPDRLPTRALNLRMLDQVWASLDGNGSAAPLQGNDVFAWAR